jgi:hypothetical protein
MDQTGPRQRGYMAAGFAASRERMDCCVLGRLARCPVARRWRRDVRRSYSVELIFWKARLTYGGRPGAAAS